MQCFKTRINVSREGIHLNVFSSNAQILVLAPKAKHHQPEDCNMQCGWLDRKLIYTNIKIEKGKMLHCTK